MFGTVLCPVIFNSSACTSAPLSFHKCKTGFDNKSQGRGRNTKKEREIARQEWVEEINFEIIHAKFDWMLEKSIQNNFGVNFKLCWEVR